MLIQAISGCGAFSGKSVNRHESLIYGRADPRNGPAASALPAGRMVRPYRRRAQRPQFVRSDLQPVSRCGMVAVMSTSLPADWRQAATPKHRVSVRAVANISMDKNWLTPALRSKYRVSEHRAAIRKMQPD